MAEAGKMVNTSKSNSISYSDSKKFDGMLQLNRKLGNRGRNVTLRGDFSYKDGDSKSLSTNNVHLYQIKMKDNPKPTPHTRQTATT